MHVDSVTCRIRVLQSFGSSLNIRLICLPEMLCHGCRSRRTIDLEWFVASHDPRRKHDISKPERMIRMQMGNESDLKIRWLQGFDTFVTSCRGAPDDSRSDVNKVRSAVDHDGRARP